MEIKPKAAPQTLYVPSELVKYMELSKSKCEPNKWRNPLIRILWKNGYAKSNIAKILNHIYGDEMRASTGADYVTPQRVNMGVKDSERLSTGLKIFLGSPAKPETK